MEGAKESLLFLMLAHHEPRNLHRTIRVRLLSNDYYLCARCTGKYAGILTVFSFHLFRLYIPVWQCLLIMLFFPLPSILDWSTQSLSVRESRNSIRIFTGYLLGMAWGIFYSFLVRGLLFPFLLGLMIVILYVLVTFMVLWRGGLAKISDMNNVHKIEST